MRVTSEKNKGKGNRKSGAGRAGVWNTRSTEQRVVQYFLQCVPSAAVNRDSWNSRIVACWEDEELRALKAHQKTMARFLFG